MNSRIAILGLGYVGLPVVLGFAEHFAGTIGFDISKARVDALRTGHDWTGEASTQRLTGRSVGLTNNPDDLGRADVFIVCVPTPICPTRLPDLRPLQAASETVGKVMRKGAIVVYESTVY